MKRYLSIGILALTGAVAACGDSTGPDEEVSGSFELEVTGAFNEAAEGPAWFGSDVNDEGDPVFLLLLGDETSRHTVILATQGANRPAVGTGTIGTGGWELVHLISDDEEMLGMFFGDEGQVRITASSSGVLRGEIDFVASSAFTEGEEIEGTVTFEAVPAPAQMSVTHSLR